MGKRQVILNADSISSYNGLEGEEVNVLMKSARVWHGYVKSVSGSSVALQDTRFKIHNLEIQDIDKLYLDRVTDY